MRGVCCCTGFSLTADLGATLHCGHRFLIAAASLVAAQAPGCMGFRGCGPGL